MPKGSTLEDAAADYGIHERVARALFQFSGVSAQFRLFNGTVYVRLSAQVYNVKEDYLRLGRAVLDVAHDIEKSLKA
jgi:hypothetical protein